jgi:hypothetical protein
MNSNESFLNRQVLHRFHAGTLLNPASSAPELSPLVQAFLKSSHTRLMRGGVAQTSSSSSVINGVSLNI